MTKTKIFSLLMIPVVIVLGYLLIAGIKNKIDTDKAIKASEARVREQLKVIRTAEKEFLAKYGYYTSNWDSLINFVKNDSIFIVEKKEIITPWSERDRKDPKYFQRIDSVRIEYDTLETYHTQSYLFPEDKFPGFNADDLNKIPGKEGKTFEIFSDKIDKRGVKVDVIEVVDRFPLDPTRSDENPSPTRWHLRFGSRTDVTTSGNWE